MRLIFLINRNNDYVGLSNIIDYALQKKHDVNCIRNYAFNKTGNKKHLFPNVKKSPCKEVSSLVSLVKIFLKN